MLGLDVQARFMANRDFDRVIEIDCTSGGEYAWSPDDLYAEWKADNGVGIVAVDSDDFPLGFCVYNLNNKEYYEMKHLVVDRSFQRSGVGTALIDKMKHKLNNQRYLLSFDVPEENLATHLFLRKMGFKAQVIRNRYGDIYRFQYEKV